MRARIGRKSGPVKSHAQRSFAFETTLASRSLAPRIRRLIATGYECHLVFLWLPSADQAVARVAARVRLGGHASAADLGDEIVVLTRGDEAVAAIV